MSIASHPLGALRLLVVDDSHYNRQIISDAFADSRDVAVVGHASNGEQALRMVAELDPDVITLDVEMPKMDGFTFLRILMHKKPTPVIVISSRRSPENVFRAIELGALDFVSKPEVGEMSTWQTELRDKITQTKHADAHRIPTVGGSSPKLGATRVTPPQPPPQPLTPTSAQTASNARAGAFPLTVVGLAASTGGPGAILHILSRIPATHTGAILIAQHMSPTFTRSFAERLDRTSPLTVLEATDGDPVIAGRVYVCPGGSCMELRKDANGLRVAVVPPSPADRYVPNANRLLTSIAHVMGPRATALVLTGMADDGLEGARSIRRVGGIVIAESEQTAVVNGMPGAVIREGLAHRILPLPDIAEELVALR
ncbi:MAG: chemotaxis-specific protein-glutamate methyltransferase CheB [Polyangiaceae bacterium]